MEFLSTNEIATKWNISERSVRNYCADGKIQGAVLKGKIWQIPINAMKPSRTLIPPKLLTILQEEQKHKIKGGIYHKIQIDLTYNTNHIEGSSLTPEQTRYIYETNTIGLTNETLNVDDIIETINHFKCIDKIIKEAYKPLSEKFIKELHFLLKNNTSTSNLAWFAIGNYKIRPNEIGWHTTTDPKDVADSIKNLLEDYNKVNHKTLNDLLEFHFKFERIHPFQDGNGRVGRLILFKECLKNNIVPFIITDNIKLYYYRGLENWQTDKAYLIDTCLVAQDTFKTYLDYYKIPYKN